MADLPDYRKSVAGVPIAQCIGLAAMRRECARLQFNEWVKQLPAPGTPSSRII
jgi:hypothetical protein